MDNQPGALVMYLRSFNLLVLLAAASLAHAQDRPIGFLTPSKDIACQFNADNGQGVLRCDIMNVESHPRRPADCELDYGHAFEMSAKRAAGRICAGDTVMDAHCRCSPMARCGSAGGYMPVGADGADVLQRDAARVFAGEGKAGGVLTDERAATMPAEPSDSMCVLSFLAVCKRR